MTLTVGAVYDVDEVRPWFMGWRRGGDGWDHHPEGYLLDAYFDARGRYRGADEFGVEPVFAIDENPRQRGDDDGVEYGDPRDERDERRRR